MFSRSDARVLIVDELDSVLTVQELAPVFRVLRSLRARGMYVLYISHRIESLAELCDRVCIIREGQIRDTLDAGDPDSRGRLIERLCRAPERQRHPRIYQPAGRVVLQAEGLSTAHGLRGASLQLRKGEVLGIAGFLGSGRSALARAILKDAPIVVLDEASSFADPENEAKIQKAFEALMKGKTVLMIAHRLSTVRNMDRILVIRDGEIAEEGKHDELLEKGGVYAAMWEEYQKAAQWKVGGAA